MEKEYFSISEVNRDDNVGSRVEQLEKLNLCGSVEAVRIPIKES